MSSLVQSTPAPPRRVLFATDFSPSSELAAQYAIELCHRYKSILNTVTVVPQEVTDSVQPPDPFFLRHAAERKMANFVRAERLAGIEHHEMVIEGFVANVILKLIPRLSINVVVLGTHGHGGIKKLVLGSLAEEVVNSASCQILTVGPQVSPRPAKNAGLRKILCATNLIHGWTRALSCALWLAEQEHATLSILHVLPVSAVAQEGNPQARRTSAAERFAQLLPPEANSRAAIEFVVEVGAAPESILRVAAERGADLIVLGAHASRNPRIASHLPGRMTHHVIRHASCPVLTVRD